MGFLDWMFRSRKTGRITLAQLPNWQFAVWLLASAVMLLGHPWGWVRAVLVVLASAALALWAGGRGVAWGETSFVASWDSPRSLGLSSPW